MHSVHTYILYAVWLSDALCSTSTELPRLPKEEEEVGGLEQRSKEESKNGGGRGRGGGERVKECRRILDSFHHCPGPICT